MRNTEIDNILESMNLQIDTDLVRLFNGVIIRANTINTKKLNDKDLNLLFKKLQIKTKERIDKTMAYLLWKQKDKKNTIKRGKKLKHN